MWLQFLCKCGKWRPRRALIVDRAPSDAIWSEYQRRQSTGGHGTSWVSIAGSGDDCGHASKLRELDQGMWRAAATGMAHEYVRAWKAHRAFAWRHGRNATMVIAFEELSDGGARCEAALRRAVEWLKLPAAPNVRSAREMADAARAACSRGAVAVASQSFRRPLASLHVGGLVDSSSSVVNAAAAWREPELLCAVQRILRQGLGSELLPAAAALAVHVPKETRARLNEDPSCAALQAAR